jgi:hypothetical protein
VTGTATLTPTVTRTYVIMDFFEIRDPLAGPNPHNGKDPLQVYFNPTRPCSAVTFKVYTNSLRLIRRIDLGSCGAGMMSRTVAASNMSGLANGTYFYIITGAGDEGTARSRAEKLLVVK